MADQAQDVADQLAWWQDKQVALVVGPTVVRGWVLAAVPRVPSGDAGASIGHLTIVPFIGPQPLARQYPSEVTVAVHAGGPHGRAHRVLGLWTENDLTDVRPHQGTNRSSLTQVQTVHGNGQLTTT